MKGLCFFKNGFRRAVSLCLAFCLLGSVFSFPSCADTEETYPVDHSSPYYLIFDSIEELDADAFTQFLYGKILEQATKITLPADIVLPQTYGEDEESTIQAVYDWLFYDCPALFHMTAVGYDRIRTVDGIPCISRITVAYTEDSNLYQEQMYACEKSAASLLKGIEGNNSLSDVQKALLIHDRLAVLCAYNQGDLLAGTLTHEDYTMYGALVNRTAVCQGYAAAYKYLLARVGIFSYVCGSDDINHAWNVVYIGGKPYHVDVTHDDPVNGSVPYDEPGRVYHDHFLVNDTRIRSLHYNVFGVSSVTYDVTLPQKPTSSTYHNAYWRDLVREVMLISGSLYYCVDDVSDEYAYLKTESGTVVTELYFDCCLREETEEGTEYWTNYPMPSSLKCGAYMGYFLYSQPDGIYGYNVTTRQTRKFFGMPVANGTHEEDYFYAFGCSDGVISYDVYATCLEYVPEDGTYSYTAPVVSSHTVRAPIFDANQDGSLDILDLIKAKKMLAVNQVRFLERCGQVGNAVSLTLIQRALLEQ